MALLRHAAVGPSRPRRRWHYPLLGVVAIVAALAVMVALESDDVVEETVATAAPTAEPTSIPTPTPEPATASDDHVAESQAAPEAAEADEAAGADVASTDEAVANTEAASGAALVDSASYVPTFVAAVDRKSYAADVSAPLAAPTPTSAPAAVSADPATARAPTPTAAPEPEPEPTPETPERPELDPAPEDGTESEDVADADDGGGGGGPTAEQWAALRACESGGNYQIISPNGLYRGAYQFSVPTWDSIAAAVYPSLVGVDPAQASPADQDAMAYALYAMRGASPWPHCGRHLS